MFPLGRKVTVSERETDREEVFTVVWKIRWHYLIETRTPTYMDVCVLSPVSSRAEQFNCRQMLGLSQDPDTTLKTHAEARTRL